MGRQFCILPVWLACILVAYTPVTALLDEALYDDLMCTDATIDDAGIDPNAISSDVDFTGPDNNLAFSYVCENFKYMFKCCGKIKEWKLYAGKPGTIQLQVWRRNDTRTYLLVGENYCTITTANALTTCVVDDYDKILVRQGDFIGWHNQGNETLMYKQSGRSESILENMFRRINAGDLFPGDTYDWSEVEAYNDRLYAIQAIYEESTNPAISAADMIVPDYISSGDTIGRILYKDLDVMDNSSLVVVSTRTSAYYTTDIPSGYVDAKNTYRPRDDSLEYFVYDLCYRTASDSHTITVQETTLQIDNLDATFTVSESNNVQTLLHTITVTDPVDQWFCYSGWATDLPFMLKAITTTSYGFYVVEEGLDYDTTSHYTTLPVTCVENSVTSTATVAANIQVYVTQNQPPVITNLYAAVEVDAETANIGDNIYTVLATDPEGDPITFSFRWCRFRGSGQGNTVEIFANGNIVVKRLLLLSTRYHLECRVRATDSYGNFDQGEIHISILNIDTAPVITNMPPDMVDVKENTPVGTSLYQFEYYDPDNSIYDAKTWSVSFSDATASRFFSIDPDTGVLSFAFSEIDAEEVGVNTIYTATVMIADIKSSVTEDFDIRIINENEAPWFTEDIYTIDEDEGDDGYQITDGTMFAFEDEDLSDGANSYEDHFFSLDCDNATNTERFYIDTNTGAIRYNGPYDIDTSGTPTALECIITVTDQFGLFDTAELFIHIKNVNEHSPEFTQAQYSFYRASNILVGTLLTTVTAIDHDSSDDYDNEITYTLNHAAIPAVGGKAAGNEILAVTGNGELYTADTLDEYIGSTLGPIEILASNYLTGQTGTAYVTIVIPSTTTTSTTTTDRNKDFYEDQWSYYWLLASLFGITLIVVSISVVCFRICRLTRIGPYCYQCCMKGICCKPPPPQPRGFGDKGYDLASFGHRHKYADEDAEVDGWLLTKRDAKKKKTTPLNGDGRYGTPNSGYDWSNDLRPGPIYEMFKVPSTSTVPKAANYLDPHTSTRTVPRSERKPLMSRR